MTESNKSAPADMSYVSAPNLAFLCFMTLLLRVDAVAYAQTLDSPPEDLVSKWRTCQRNEDCTQISWRFCSVLSVNAHFKHEVAQTEYPVPPDPLQEMNAGEAECIAALKEHPTSCEDGRCIFLPFEPRIVEPLIKSNGRELKVVRTNDWKIDVQVVLQPKKAAVRSKKH